MGWHWLIKLFRFQVYNSMINHLYSALCVHHPKSNLLLLPYIWSPLLFTTLHLPSLWLPPYCWLCLSFCLFSLFVHLLLSVLYIMLSKISQTEKVKNYMILFMYDIKLKNLVVILMWSWEEVNGLSNYSAILTRTVPPLILLYLLLFLWPWWHSIWLCFHKQTFHSSLQYH